MDGRVVVGRVGRAHGLSGELYVSSESDYRDRFRSGSVFLTVEPSPRTLEVRSKRSHRGKLLVHFKSVESRDEAEALQGVGLTIAASERRLLAEDEYWPDQLIGLAVRDGSGAGMGRVADVQMGTGQDRLIVVGVDGREATVPFVAELVPEVRIEEGFIVVEPIEGLLNPSPD